MKITIVVDDQRVIVDRVGLHMPDLDWSKFDGDPSSPWDDIAAVQFDTGLGQGHIEYREITTAQVSRHNMRPPDWMINQSQFDSMFGWVLPRHAACKAAAEAERAALNAEAERMREERRATPATEHGVSPISAEFIAAKDAEISALRERLESLDRKVSVITEAAMETAVENAGR